MKTRARAKKGKLKNLFYFILFCFYIIHQIYGLPNTLHQAGLVVQQIGQTQTYYVDPILDPKAATGQNGDRRTLKFRTLEWVALDSKAALKVPSSSYYSSWEKNSNP